MTLPFLPGNSFNCKVGKEKFHKSQHWSVCNNVRMLASEEKPGIGGEPLHGKKVTPKSNPYPKGDGCSAPSWVAFDKQVLSFDAYLEEELPDKSQEDYRIRYYKIYFYLEDDTIQVNEPQVLNSGLFQGTSIRRHRIPLPPPNDDLLYNVYHFNINIDIVFYGRRFKIYDCDAFTKNFLRKIGTKLNLPGKCPIDPYTKMRRDAKSVDLSNIYHSPHTFKQFLQYDQKVLRFSCLWDDTASLYGERRELILLYFLCDDTIEIREALPDTLGRNVTALFLRRGKLPKHGPPRVYQPGQLADRAVLNRCSGLSLWRTDAYQLDKRETGRVKQEFYTDKDLYIGATINVWGRKVLLCDCDEYTKFYYKTRYGMENFTAIPCKLPPLSKAERKVPPDNGLGSEEDSLSCKPAPQQKNFKKLLEQDSYGSENSILRYFAKLVTDKCADEHRLFIIAYYLSDDTISVFEPTERNSGNTGGMFLKRARAKKPGQAFKSELSEYIQPEDLYVGTTVNVNGYLFRLLHADEYTLKYMENNTARFPLSNLELAVQKLKQEKCTAKEIKQLFAAADDKYTGVLPYKTFRDILLDRTVGKLTEQEILTIARHYRVPEIMDPDLNCLIAQAHEKFKKNMFENFDIIVFHCVYEDGAKKGVLPTKDIRRLCKASRLPLSDDLLTKLLFGFEDNEQQIDYMSFFSVLNWRKNPTPEIQSPPYLKERCEESWIVRYVDLVKDAYDLEAE